MCREITAPHGRVLAGQCRELRDVAGKALELGIDDRIGSISRDHAAFPAGRANLLVVEQRIERRFGRRDDLDVEALEQRARAEGRLRQARVDAVEVTVRRFRGQPLVDAEHRVERMVEPDARRRAAEEMVARGEGVPYLARVAVGRRAIAARNAEFFERHALAVQHPENVVIRRDEQRGRVGERRVVGKPLRIGVAVRAHDRQGRNRRVEAAREVPRRRIGGE